MRPLTESLKYLDAATLSSAEFNQFARSLVRDVTAAYNSVNDLNDQLQDTILAITEENLALQQRLAAQEALLCSLEETRLNGSERRKVTYHAFQANSELRMETAQHDALYGLVTLPQTDLVASVYQDYPADFLAKNVSIRFTARTPSGTVAAQYGIASRPDLVRLIDRDVATYWIERLTLPDTTEYVDFTVELDAASRICPTLVANALGLCPFPVYNLTLQAAAYTDLDNTVHLLNRTSPQDPNGFFDLPAGGLGNLKLYFPAVAAKTISLTFRQANYTTNGTSREFVCGLRGVSVEKLSVAADSARFLYTVRLPKGKYFNLVNIPTSVDYQLLDLAAGDSVRYELFLGDNTELPYTFNTRIRSNVSVVTLRGILSRTGEAIPCLSGLKLPFELK
jgi:hypothetical protein